MKVSFFGGLRIGRVCAPDLSDDGALFGKTFAPSECLRILCWFGEPGLGSLPVGCRRTVETRVKAAWTKPLPPSRKTASSLT